MHRGREKAVANTPHFTIIFTVFYFIQKNAGLRPGLSAINNKLCSSSHIFKTDLVIISDGDFVLFMYILFVPFISMIEICLKNTGR